MLAISVNACEYASANSFARPGPSCSTSFAAMSAASRHIWGVRPEGGEPEQLASLINCGLDENDLQAMFIDDEGCINCLFYDNDDGSAQLARLKLVDATELPETTVLRLACFYLSG